MGEFTDLAGSPDQIVKVRLSYSSKFVILNGAKNLSVICVNRGEIPHFTWNNEVSGSFRRLCFAFARSFPG